MAHRLRLVCIIAVSFLTSAALALGQSTSSLGLGFSGSLAPGSYQSLGTVPALSGQTSASTSSTFRDFSRAPESGEYGRQYGNYGYYTSDLASLFPGYFASYFDGGYADAYGYGGGPYQQGGSQQNGNGNQSQSQNDNQNQGMNGNQNQNQGKQGQGKQEAPPEKPQYLTYTPKKESLQEQAKSGKSAAVDFKSSPDGAEITVDGYFVGRTPTTVHIPLGEHLVSITKWGYRSWDQELNVTDEKSVSINSTLQKDW